MRPEDRDSDKVYLVSSPVDLSPGIDLKHWMSVFWQGKWIILGLMLGLGAAAFGASYLIKPVYQADVVVSPVTEDGNRGLAGLASQLGAAGLAGLNLAPSDSRRAEAIAVLRSRVLVEQLITTENLLPVLFAGEWDNDANEWIDSDEAPTLQDAYTLFDSDIRSVDDDTATGMVTLSIEWMNPALAAAWASKLVSLADSRLRETAIDEARSSIEFLESELETTSVVALQQVMTRLIESQINNITLANSRREYAFRVIDPPIVADRDHYVWPDRGFLLRAGLAVGLLVGALWVFVLTSMRNARES